MVKTLLEQGALGSGERAVRGNGGAAALHVALLRRNVPIIKQLIAHFPSLVASVDHIALYRADHRLFKSDKTLVMALEEVTAWDGTA